jgi:hypothetical protein
MKYRCNDCGLEVSEITKRECWTNEDMADHIGFCCDCYDEKYGMPEEKRSIPRPKK